MTEKTKKKPAAKKEKVLKVEIIAPEIKIAPETYKKEPIKEEPALIPADPTPKPVVNPNNPKIEGIDTGFKRPSITNVKQVYTPKQYRALIEAYKIQNPAKYERKRSELEAKAKGK